MKDKKHIDELFRKRFQGHAPTPSPEVWKGIEARLKKEEDRKVVPLWLRWSGVAAVLILLLLAGNFVFDPFGTPQDNTTITDTTEDSKDSKTDTDKTVIDENTVSDDTDIASEEDLNTNSDATEKSPDEEGVKPAGEGQFKTPETIRDAVANESVEDKKVKEKDRDSRIKKDVVESIGVTDTDAAVTTEKDASNKIKNTTEAKDIKDNPVLKDDTTNKVINTETDTGVANTKVDDTDVKKDNPDNLIRKDVDIIDSDTPVVTAVEKDDTAKEEDTTQKEEDAEADKPSLIGVINEKNTEEAITKRDTPDRRWEVTPNVGPVYYDSFGSGSSIDPMFSDNPQNSDINISYGVAVSYNITDRFSVRSGINNVRLSYSTGGIELVDNAPVGIALRSVDYGNQQNVTTAYDRGTLASAAENGPFGGLQPKSGGGNPEINQRINYFEVPLEVRYAILDSRFGINMIGGFSTLFLGSNEISVSDGSFRSTLGEANNLNSVSFATNIGFGFDYKISRSLRFNVEPIFKYQLNPYTDPSVNFRPYYLGVYSGLSFKF